MSKYVYFLEHDDGGFFAVVVTDTMESPRRYCPEEHRAHLKSRLVGTTIADRPAGLVQAAPQAADLRESIKELLTTGSKPAA